MIDKIAEAITAADDALGELDPFAGLENEEHTFVVGIMSELEHIEPPKQSVAVSHAFAALKSSVQTP